MTINSASATSAAFQAPAFYVVSGTLPLQSQSYVARQADKDLLSALLSGEYCFVLNSRQMGKSSLSVRAMARLQEAGVRTVFLDLTKIGGGNVTPEQWYIGLLSETGRALGLGKEFLAYWKENQEYSLVQRYFGALHAIALARIASPLVLFIDEIDAVKGLSFSTDEFFAAIRECYNRRVQEPEYGRLAFALVGSATASDLIKDTRTSPFNIGQRIELKDFTLEEALPLAEGIDRPNASSLVERAFYWTNGHPFLTQALCAEIAADPKAQRAADVDRLVAQIFFEAKARERNVNLADVSNRILSSYLDPEHQEEHRAAILDLYRKVWSGRTKVVDDETNRLVVALCQFGMIGVWDLADNKRRLVVACPKPFAVTFTADSRSLLAADGVFGLIHRYDLLAGKESKSVPYPPKEKPLLALSPDGKHYLCSKEKGSNSLEVRTLGADQTVCSLTGHTAGVNMAVYTPDGRRILTASNDRTARIWNALTGHELAILKGHKADVTTVAISGNGQQIATSGLDHTLRLWTTAPRPDVQPGPEVREKLAVNLLQMERLREELAQTSIGLCEDVMAHRTTADKAGIAFLAPFPLDQATGYVNAWKERRTRTLFYNRMAEPAKLYRLDVSGQPQMVATIPPRRAVITETYGPHLWLVTNMQAKKSLDLYVADGPEGVVIIDPFMDARLLRPEPPDRRLPAPGQ